jgi:hypothetical protein
VTAEDRAVEGAEGCFADELLEDSRHPERWGDPIRRAAFRGSLHPLPDVLDTL